MSNSIDIAHERLSSLIDEFERILAEKPNESDTRLKILDRMLTEVLTWKHSAILSEPPTQSGFIDYLLSIGDRPVAVIEAKKSGKLKPATKNQEKMVIALDGPVAKPLKDGIKQAIRYSAESGVSYALLSDGNTSLFFQSTRKDGRKPIQGKGILFPTIRSVLEFFPAFHDLLSESGIVNGLNISQLVDAEGITVSEAEQQYAVLPPSSSILTPRSELATDAASLFKEFFSKISDSSDREMLIECFVETSESTHADFEIQKILEKVINNVTTLSESGTKAMQSKIERSIQLKISDTVLLIGNESSGKSTFVDRFFEHVLPRAVRNNCALVIIDFDEYHDADGPISDWCNIQIRKKLEEALFHNHHPSYDELRGIFFDEYQRLSTGSWKPVYESDKVAFRYQFGQHTEQRRENHPAEYVRLLLARSINVNQKLPCIVFDNTDARSPSNQDIIYQLVRALESSSPVFSIIPVTDRTAWRLSRSDNLRNFGSRKFWLPVPDAKEIIERRIQFIERKLHSSPKMAGDYFARKGIHVKLNDLTMLSSAVHEIFIGQTYVTGLIGRLGNFNIDSMLTLVEQIFVSPEIAIDDLIKAKISGEPITTDIERTHRALIKGERDRLDEKHNEYITNLFETDPKQPSSPLLSFYILWLCRQKLNGAPQGSVEDKHWNVVELLHFLEPCGVSQEVAIKNIRRLHDRKLVQTLDPTNDQVNLVASIAIRESGIAHIELVLNSREYIEEMSYITGYNEYYVKDQVKRFMKPRTAHAKRELFDVFNRYIDKNDTARMTIPTSRNYDQLRSARNAFVMNARRLLRT